MQRQWLLDMLQTGERSATDQSRDFHISCHGSSMEDTKKEAEQLQPPRLYCLIELLQTFQSFEEDISDWIKFCNGEEVTSRKFSLGKR